jgi:signal transduction histidine kinase
MEEFLIFEEETDKARAPKEMWKILIVDDDENVHAVTKLALGNVKFHNKKLSFSSAYNVDGAMKLLKESPDYAIALIDIVMESKDAGLQLVEKIRTELKNLTIRLIIRTGQPGEAPARYVIDNFDINDYKEKTELTSDRLYASIRTALAHYEQIISLQNNLDQKVAALLEEERKNEQLSLNQAKHTAQNEMLSTIAHQWRQPLSSISILAGNLQLKHSLHTLEDDFLVDTLDKVMHTTDQLSATISLFRDLFDQNRSNEMIELNSMVENAIVFFSPTLNSTHTTIINNITQPTKVSKNLVQVLINILKNAQDALLDAHPEAPTITLFSSSDEETLTISIEDNGTGVHESVSNHIFEPYVTTKSLNGKGIGLFLCHSVVTQQLNGSLSFENLKEGVRFNITLPIH